MFLREGKVCRLVVQGAEQGAGPVGGEVEGCCYMVDGRGWRWRSVNEVVCRTQVRLDRCRAGEGEVGLCSSSSSSAVDHRLVHELGRGGGDLSLAALVEDSRPVAPEMVDCVLDGLQAAVGQTDVVGPSSVAAVSVLGVTELVAAVVVLHCVGKYVASLWILLGRDSREEGQHQQNHFYRALSPVVRHQPRTLR